MTCTDHTANFRRFQAALVCEQCHALYQTCPHHTRGIRASLRTFWQRWARKREQREAESLRTQIAALNAQLSEAEGRLDAETARRKNAEQRLVREKLAHAGYLAATSPGKVRPKG
jgi:C4-dicarboxylate-specific signal transduction histidine kinase